MRRLLPVLALPGLSRPPPRRGSALAWTRLHPPAGSPPSAWSRSPSDRSASRTAGAGSRAARASTARASSMPRTARSAGRSRTRPGADGARQTRRLRPAPGRRPRVHERRRARGARRLEARGCPGAAHRRSRELRQPALAARRVRGRAAAAPLAESKRSRDRYDRVHDRQREMARRRLDQIEQGRQFHRTA